MCGGSGTAPHLHTRPSSEAANIWISNDGALEYKVREVIPTCKHEGLMVTEYYCNEGDMSEQALAIQAICEVLNCSVTIVHALEENDVDKSLILVTLVTHFWVEDLIKSNQLPEPERLIKALVINFFLNLSDARANRQPEIDESLYSHSLWIKVYHALLVWKGLYRNVYSLNAMLCKPLQPRSPFFLFDGPLIIFLTLHESPQIIDTYRNMLTPEEKRACDKLFELLLSHM